MLESFPVSLIVGTVLGFLSGLGIGGGSLLILWLTLILDAPQQTARGINLLFFLPAAAIAAIFRWKQGMLPFKTVLPAAAAGCLAAALFTWLGVQMMDLQILKKLFGLLLIATGLRELLYKTKDAQSRS